MKNMKAAFLSLGKDDLIKSAIMAGMAVIVTALISILQGVIAQPPVYPTLQTLWAVLISGVSTAGIYLLKNLFTNSKDEFLKKEPTPAP